MGITRTYLSLGECALYRHTLRDRLYHRRSSRDHVRFGGLFQLLVRRGSVYPFRDSVRSSCFTVTAFVFFFNFVFRLYWGFVGNRYARWNNFIPLKKSQWKEVLEVIKVDILLIKNKPVDSIGHNALASLIYFGTFWAFLLQSITGFGLYAKMSQSFFPQLFAWTIPLMGGDLMARQIHHFLMWFFILFAIVHIYLVFYHDYIEQRGETSSIIGGWKFIEEDIADKEEVTETAETITKIAKKG